MIEFTEWDVIRFWDKVDQEGPDDCWPWTQCRSPFGHGIFHLRSGRLMAHRFAWMMVNGSIPEGLCICHLCNYPPCCNPRHLQAASLSVNQRQRRAQGRHSRRTSDGVDFYPYAVPKNLSAEEQFWGKVDRRSPAECWLWKGVKDRAGYGIMGRTHRRAHRIALALSGIPVAPGEFVLHSCDNPPCCNPAHLRLGNAADNMADCLCRRRHNPPSGERNACHKLTWAAVRALRAEPPMQSSVSLGIKYGIDARSVWNILQGKTWKDPLYAPPPWVFPGVAAGERHASAVLTWEKVRIIRSLYPGLSLRALGRQFGVSGHQIWLIVNGKAWKE